MRVLLPAWCAGLFSFLLAIPVQAEVEYWVAVGSYKNIVYAETARDEAATGLAESLSINPVETASGLFYRVAAGPYLTREIANHVLSEAKRIGFSGAWLLSAEAAYSMLPLESSSELDLESSTLEYESWRQSQFEDSPQPVDPGLDLSDPEQQKESHELIDEAPPGYRLNKLNRDQTRIDWHSPFLLATTESSVISAALAAQQRPPPLAVDVGGDSPVILQQWTHQSAAVIIDGKLEEPAWQNAMAIQQFKVTEPDTLVEPPYNTEVRLFYTERGIYVSFNMEQPAATLVKRLSSRDNRDVNRDYVSFTLDTSGNARYAYWMTLALGDTQMDGTALPERKFSSNWDGAWWGASVETEQGWAAEFFVPWSQMSMPKLDEGGRRTIGFYGARLVAHLNQRWAWPALPRSQPKFMSAFQPIEVQDVNPKQQWSLFPYASSTTDFAVDDTSAKAGVDVFWRPATNTQLTATLNPDFGTVESDEVIVNLTALETFFPEKRLFFLEGREIFETSSRSRGFDPVVLLNTRRIGQSPRVSLDDDDLEFPPEETGQPTELYGAGKVTGQIGSVRYGVLTAFEQDTTLVSEEGDAVNAIGRDYAVARVLYEDNLNGAYRGLGLMTTLTTHPDEDATTAGLDYHYLSRTGAWKVDGQFLYSDLDLTGSGGGGFVDVAFTPRMGMKYIAEFTHYDDNLDINDLGFLQRNDKTGGRVGTEWIKSGFDSFRDFNVQTFARYEENGDGYAIRSGIGGEGEFTLNNLHAVDLEVRYFPARYDDRNSFGNGTYRINGRPSVGLGYNTDPSKKISGFVDTEWQGDGIDGQRLQTRAGMNWRPVDRLNFEVSTGYQVRDGWLLHQEGRNMTAFDAEEWQPELKMDFFLNARQEFRMKLQWVGIKAFEDRFYLVPDSPGDLIEIEKPDGETDDFNISALNFQMRYRWQIAPLSDLFVVYTKNGLDNTAEAGFGELFENAWNDPLGEQLVVKVRYRLGS